MLVGSCIWCTTCKYENGMPKVARNAFNIGEVWNPVCCHGDKAVMLKLWSTFSRILVQRVKLFWYKLAKKKLKYLWNKERSVQTTSLPSWIILNHKKNHSIVETSNLVHYMVIASGPWNFMGNHTTIYEQNLRIALNNSGRALICCHPELNRLEIQSNNCRGIVSSTTLKLLAFPKANCKNRKNCKNCKNRSPCVSIFSKPLESKSQIKTLISLIVFLQELPLLVPDQLSVDSQEELWKSK